MGLYDNQNAGVGFAGMIADSRENTIESHPAKSTIIAGIAVGFDATEPNKVVAGVGGQVLGVAVHSHVVGDEFEQGDSVPVMTDGTIYAKTSGACTNGKAAKFDNNGVFSDAGANAMPNAVFRSDTITTQKFGSIVVVELGSRLTPKA